VAKEERVSGKEELSVIVKFYVTTFRESPS
jgi:hypothetical protein